MWRPATAKDIGRKCRVRDTDAETWDEDDGNCETLKSIRGGRFYRHSGSGSSWLLCEVWDPTPAVAPRTEITWENIQPEDEVRVTENLYKDGDISWGALQRRLTIIQPQPKLVITKAMIQEMVLEKYGKSKEKVEIRL